MVAGNYLFYGKFVCDFFAVIFLWNVDLKEVSFYDTKDLN